MLLNLSIFVQCENLENYFVQVKQRCFVLEEELTNLVVLAMERSEVDEDGNNQLLWQHLSSQVIFFVLFQFTSFTDMVLGLYNKVGGLDIVMGLYNKVGGLDIVMGLYNKVGGLDIVMGLYNKVGGLDIVVACTTRWVV